LRLLVMQCQADSFLQCLLCEWETREMCMISIIKESNHFDLAADLVGLESQKMELKGRILWNLTVCR
jgi:hypothetical protein